MPAVDEIRHQAGSWHEANWDPRLSLGEWWARLAESGWGYPTWPTWAYGRGLAAEGAKVAYEERRRVGAIGPPSGIASTLAGPTIIAHGSDEQADAEAEAAQERAAREREEREEAERRERRARAEAELAALEGQAVELAQAAERAEAEARRARADADAAAEAVRAARAELDGATAH